MDKSTSKDSGLRAIQPPVSNEPPASRKAFWGLVQRRSCLVPTWRGWMMILLVGVALTTIGVRSLHPFLALNSPVQNGFLVIEGWSPDYGLAAAIEQFKHGSYQKIYVTGGPLEQGTYLSSYKTYAQLGAAILTNFGLDSNVVQAVPAPKVRQDRTYVSALSLKHWLLERNIKPERILLMTHGPHSRRSRLLYQKAFGPGVTVGVISIPAQEYDEEHWWRYSAGVRNVIGEGLAYLYARFLFSAPTDP